MFLFKLKHVLDKKCKDFVSRSIFTRGKDKKESSEGKVRLGLLKYFLCLGWELDQYQIEEKSGVETRWRLLRTSLRGGAGWGGGSGPPPRPSFRPRINTGKARWPLSRALALGFYQGRARLFYFSLMKMFFSKFIRKFITLFF